MACVKVNGEPSHLDHQTTNQRVLSNVKPPVIDRWFPPMSLSSKWEGG